MKIHKVHSSEEAYDMTQTGDIPRGDVIIVESEQMVGFSDTWPIALTHNNGQFHHFTNKSLSVIEMGVVLNDMGGNFDFTDSINKARDLIDEYGYKHA